MYSLLFLMHFVTTYLTINFQEFKQRTSGINSLVWGGEHRSILYRWKITRTLQNVTGHAS